MICPDHVEIYPFRGHCGFCDLEVLGRERATVRIDPWATPPRVCDQYADALERGGWIKCGGTAGVYAIYKPIFCDAPEILLPLDPGRGDYGELLARVLHNLESVATRGTLAQKVLDDLHRNVH